MSIKDRRKSGWYRIDNIILDKYSAELGAYGIAVYNALARLADNETRTTFRSSRRIASLLHISQRKVVERLRMLAKLKLIEITCRETSDGDRDTNEYTLLDLAENSEHDTTPVAMPARARKNFSFVKNGDGQERARDTASARECRRRLVEDEQRRIAELDRDAQRQFRKVEL